MTTNRIVKALITLVAFLVASSVANFVSRDILDHRMVRLTYFYEVFFPLVALIWMGRDQLKRRIVNLSIAIGICLGTSLLFPVAANIIADSNIALAANILGFESMVVFVVYAWLWSKMRGITAESNTKSKV